MSETIKCKDYSKYLKKNEATIIDIVFMQNSDAQEPLDIYREKGPKEALEYLKKWDYGDGHMEYDDLPAGTNDTIYYEHPYIMSVNLSHQYIGLNKLVK